MNKYKIERAWKEIKISDLMTVADAMLESPIRVKSKPLANGTKGLVTIQFTKDPNYLDTPDSHFRTLKSLTNLLEEVAPPRFRGAHFSHGEAEFEINITYRLPLWDARFSEVDDKTFMETLAVFEASRLLSQALRGSYYSGRLKDKFPDPRHRVQQVIYSKLPFLDYAVRIHVPERRTTAPLQNQSYFD
ncbi:MULTISPECIES: hypothetical protein [Ralstonia]|uniref:Uncharacterized protein n=2 Tax=Ralstonia TaxID=48736 RepID=A0AAD2F615_9RALS|nr:MULTISPECIES: hypothetical protein [Ralstonia]NMV39845.1 hypothetical protein [Ralstonia insidiosa]CAJ0807808.1 hypothetical protein R77560_04629 [Ralstonia sp. LMG 18095]